MNTSNEISIDKTAVQYPALSSTPAISICRPVYNEETFAATFGDDCNRFELVEWLKTRLHKTHLKASLCIMILQSWFPCVVWLSTYNIKTDLIPDIIAGTTVGILSIKGMAYGMLAGLTPIFGLYSSFYPPLLYAFFGTSRHISIGTFAVSSLMVATAVNRIASKAMPAGNVTVSDITGTSSWLCGNPTVHLKTDSEMAIDVAITLCFLVGVFQIILGVLHMGFLSVYLSKQLVQGVTTGAAVLVLSSQVGQFFGIKGLSKTGYPFEIFKFYGCVAVKISSLNWLATIIAVVCCIVIVLVKMYINPCFEKKFKFPIPTELLLIIFFTTISYCFDLKKNYHTATVGHIPQGLLPPRLPRTSLFLELIPDAISISIVTYTMAVSMGKLFAEKHGYRISPNQEWFALGLVHVLSSFFGCHASSASLSRSLLQEQQGGRTQIVSIIAALIILVVLLSLSPLFECLPQCVFAAIIVVALRGMFVQLKELPPLWRVSKIDFSIWVFSFVAIVVLNMTYGLAASIGFAVMTIVFRAQWPHSVCLGNVPSSELYRCTRVGCKVRELDGVKIYRFDSPLSFANVEVFKQELYRKVQVDPVLYRTQHSDKSKMKHLKHVEAEEMKQLKTENDAQINDVDSHRLKFVIVDCSSFSYVDVSGTETLQKLYTEYKSIGITVLFACCKLSVRNFLTECGFYQTVPKTFFFVSIHDAAMFCSQTDVVKNEN